MAEITLPPMHEVLLDKIFSTVKYCEKTQADCDKTTGIEAKSFSLSMLAVWSGQLDAFLLVLSSSALPEDALETFIEALKKITYKRQSIEETIAALENRRGAATPAAS